jgi:hypothetical protein
MGRALLLSIVTWSAVAVAQIPVLQVSPTSLTVVIDGQAFPVPQAVRIRNMGSGSLRWTASPAVPWIRVSPQAGTGPAFLTVEIDRSGLAPGRHEGRIVIDAGDADDSPVSVAVIVEVAAAAPPGPPARAAAPGAETAAPARPARPTPSTKPAPSAPEGAAGGNRPEGATASGPLRIDRQTLPPATRNLPYAQAVPIAGGTPPYEARIVEGRLPAGLVLARGSISGTARVQGNYPFVIAVTDASTPPATVVKTLALRVIILQPDTALVVGPPSISLRTQGRSRDARAMLSIASGHQRLDWTASADVPWLRVAPGSGLSPSTVEISVSARQLSAGTHLGTITVTMEGAPNSPASIPVQVTVPR